MAGTRVSAVALPEGSRLAERLAPGDFLDCYSVEAALGPREAANVVVAFPGWARALVGLRNTLLAPFGLSREGPPAADKLGAFPVESETRDELIAGFDDKHLNFRVSVMARQGRVYLATWVRRHNLGGRLYLAAIMPFHILIARNALARVARAAGKT
ncbi:MAG: DUF2867 domain-containing protein [Pseudomonadota bacterium]